MRIGELSERSGVSRRSLRYWEQQGLLRSRRLSNGYREYPADALQTVDTVRSLLAVGLLERVAEIRDDLDRKVADLTANRDALTGYLRTATDTADSLAR